MPSETDEDGLRIEAIAQDPQADLSYNADADDETASINVDAMDATLMGEHARDLLIDGGLSLESVADMVGGDIPSDDAVFTSPDWDRAQGREDFNTVSDLIG
ncbi:MAG: hypothetical protein AAGA87_02535 [Pseudomonadota bacterium]